MKTAIFWFRNDLRLTDNEALVRTIEENDCVVPVYVFCQAQFKNTLLGIPKTGKYRTQFLIESVTALRKQLRELGSDLVVGVGNPAVIVNELREEYDAQSVYCTSEYTREELDQEKDIANLRTSHGLTLFHPNDIPFTLENLPEIFTDFRKKCEKNIEVRPCFSAPSNIETPEVKSAGTIPSIENLGFEPWANDSRSVINFKGGETEAWNRLNHYFWDSQCLASYKHTRNGMVGTDYSSKFSPWLSIGAISPRSIYWEVKRFEKEVKKNQDTYWLIFELIWRDYFKFIAMKHGDRLFLKNGIRQREKNTTKNHDQFIRWKSGNTTEPFVNANMNELNATGFMSNRGRQNVASYLVHDLNIDWRIGASYFESMLIDYDVCSNYGNWQYIAGVGNDPRQDRTFNIETQAKRYDPNGTYVKVWTE